jgi:hypothetical protein
LGYSRKLYTVFPSKYIQIHAVGIYATALLSKIGTFRRAIWSRFSPTCNR